VTKRGRQSRSRRQTWILISFETFDVSRLEDVTDDIIVPKITANRSQRPGI
jgi:hypothetical protein